MITTQEPEDILNSKYLNVTSSSKYVTAYELVGIENVGQVFISAQDFLNLNVAGADRFKMISTRGTYHRELGCPDVFELVDLSIVEADLLKLGEQIKKFSTKIKDPELLAVSGHFEYWDTRGRLGVFQVRGARLCRTDWVSPAAGKKKEPAEVLNSRHLEDLFFAIDGHVIGRKSKGLMKLKTRAGLSFLERIRALEHICKLCTWREVVAVRRDLRYLQSTVPDYAMRELRPIWSNAKNRQAYVDKFISNQTKKRSK